MPDDKSKEFQNIPEEKVNPVKEKAKKKDKIEELADEIKTKYGIDVEVVKNNKYKIKRTINYLLEHYEFRYDLFSQLPELVCPRPGLDTWLMCRFWQELAHS